MKKIFTAKFRSQNSLVFYDEFHYGILTMLTEAHEQVACLCHIIHCSMGVSELPLLSLPAFERAKAGVKLVPF